ncbi:MAG: glutaredoxin [Pseudomonadales bacterium]|nr:glutaredoxin [Pseudomonadales bacterium]
MTRQIFDQNNVSPAIADQVGGGYEDTVTEAVNAVANNDIVVIGMAQNPFCKKARRALDETGKPYKYLEYGSYFKEWNRRGALKMWSGWMTLPMIFVKGTLVGGFSDLEALISSGELERMTS